MSRSRWPRWVFLGILLSWSFSHLQFGMAQDEPATKKESPAEKIRKALDQTMLLDFTGNSLDDVLTHLKAKTGVNFVLDRVVTGGIAIDDMGGGIVPAAQVHLKSEKTGKVRTALQRTLNGFNLTYVIVDDSVLITTEEIGVYRQMRQRVSFNVNEEPLHKALKELARTTGLNMVLDPRVSKSAQTPVTLEVEDATLETAVKLLAEMGNLKAVRMGNLLFVTSEDRAEKIRREEEQTNRRHPMLPDGSIGPGFPFNVPPGVFGGGMGGVAPAGIAVPMVAPPPPMVDPAPPMREPAPPERKDG